MSTHQVSILRQALPREKFQQLCHLWKQMAATAPGQEAVSISERDLLPENSRDRDNSEEFRLLVSPGFSALLSGKPVAADSSYQVSVTFDPQAIADFLAQLGERHPNWRDRLQQISATHLSDNDQLQSQFTLKLLEILTGANSNIPPPREAYPRFLPVSEVLRQQLEQERILNQVTRQIGQNLDWSAIVKMTAEQVQQLLQVDRLVIYQLNVEIVSEEAGARQLVDAVTYEARASQEIASILHFRDETCFSDIPECQDKYRQGFSLAVGDVEAASSLSPCLQALMQRLQVRAKLVTPIIVQGELWGFLIAHQCSAPRRWIESEIQFLRHIAQYLAIAIYQSQSYQQLQQQKQILESQVKQRAKELQDALLAAQAAHQFKNEFLDNISHELRTPLTCVIGLSGTLLHWSGESLSLPLEKQRQYLQTIQDSGKQLLALIDDLLELSEIEAGKLLLTISEFSLSHLCRSVLHDLQEEAARQQIDLELDSQVESEGDRFWGDRERVGQILIHLLDNGIKFSPAGALVTLRVWRENNHAVFQVEDTGIGIPQEQLPLLFEKFHQLENSRARTYGGTGLGLALTKQLVELHGGRIEVESTLGKGSLFTVWLPNLPHLQARTKSAACQSPSSPGETIVLVEKDEQVATLICELLTAANYQVIWLIDSSAAAKQIQLLEPTLVILDQQLPDVYEISQTLKQLETTQHIKILILGSQMTATDWQYLSEKRMDEYLLKPIQSALLLQKVSALMPRNSE